MKRSARDAAIVKLFLDGDRISDIELALDLPRTDIEDALRRHLKRQRGKP